MGDLPAVIVSGLVSGSAYALLALGIVIIFRSTDTANFAIGDMGTLGALTLRSAAGQTVPMGVSSVWVPVADRQAIHVSRKIGLPVFLEVRKTDKSQASHRFDLLCSSREVFGVRHDTGDEISAIIAGFASFRT